jgi:hypothetical protein
MKEQGRVSFPLKAAPCRRAVAACQQTLSENEAALTIKISNF